MLELVFVQFSFRFSLTIFQSLKNEKSGEFEDALRVVVTCICNPPKYYAEVIVFSTLILWTVPWYDFPLRPHVQPAKAMICSSDSEKRANEQVKQMNEQK